MAVGVRFHAGDFGDGPDLQGALRYVGIVRKLHAEHARPAVVAVLVFVHGVGRFHVVEEEFPVKAQHFEQAVVGVEGERAVVHAFGVVALLYKERHHGRKEPGLVFVV